MNSCCSDGIPWAHEGAVVPGERHDHVEQVPQPVVDGRRRKEEQILLLTAEKARHRRVPRRIRVAEGVSFVEHDEPIGVLVVGEHAPPPSRRWPDQLFVVGELLVADDLGGEPRLVEPRPPVRGELSGHHDENVLPPADRILLDESEADLRLARPHAVGEDDPVVLLDDAEGAAEAVLLERGETECVRSRARSQSSSSSANSSRSARR